MHSPCPNTNNITSFQDNNNNFILFNNSQTESQFQSESGAYNDRAGSPPPFLAQSLQVFPFTDANVDISPLHCCEDTDTDATLVDESCPSDEDPNLVPDIPQLVRSEPNNMYLRIDAIQVSSESTRDDNINNSYSSNNNNNNIFNSRMNLNRNKPQWTFGCKRVQKLRTSENKIGF